MKPEHDKNSSTIRHNRPEANRKYKDTVFRKLFSDKKELLSLYNALSGKECDNPDEITIVTLDNALYMGRANDLSFIINPEIMVYEHQSTYNPNMPLRNLFYIAAQYQRLITDDSLYSAKRLKIPAPVFVVFYNGVRERPDREELRLSDAFEGLTGEPNLELKVQVINVNEGHNEKLMQKCRILYEYSVYVGAVRKYLRHMDINEAVNRAVDECIKKNILREFLIKNRAEVIEMSIFEYDEEEEREKLRRTEYRFGKEEGIRLGEERGIKLGEVKTLSGFICDGIITVSQAAARLNVTESQFKEMMEEYGQPIRV